MNWNEFETIKILIAEDDIFNREFLISLFLGYDNFEIHEAEDGEEALEKILEEHYDVVLLDIHMPKKTGIEVLQIIRRSKKLITTPVIVVTSNEEDRKKALSLGANDFLVKPYDSIELQIRLYNQVKLYKYSKNLEQMVKIKHLNLLKKIEKIEETQRKLLIKFALYAERQMGAKDGGKSKKIAEYTKLLSSYCCELPIEEQKDIYYAAAIHNIGFFALPHSIKTKNGKYTKEEREIMKKHILYSKEFLKDLEETDLIKVARPIVEQYCERWDGKGYPLGLKGDEISPYARIVTIAVYFNALTTPRDYRNKRVFSDDEVYKILESQSGKIFDPILIDVFLKHFDEFLALRDKLNKPLKEKNERVG